MGIEPSIPDYLAADYSRPSPMLQLARTKAQNTVAPTTDEPLLNNEEGLLELQIATPGSGGWTHRREVALEHNLASCLEQTSTRKAQDAQ